MIFADDHDDADRQEAEGVAGNGFGRVVTRELELGGVFATVRRRWDGENSAPGLATRFVPRPRYSTESLHIGRRVEQRRSPKRCPFTIPRRRYVEHPNCRNAPDQRRRRGVALYRARAKLEKALGVREAKLKGQHNE